MAVQTIHSPKEQQLLNIAVEPGQTIAFDFDLSAASFDRTGNSLTISIEGGGQIVLDNFFVTDATGALPPLRLADGTQVASNDFLRAIDPTLDITPEAAAVESSGLNAYDANAGPRVDGLDGSEDQDSVFWTVELSPAQEQQGVMALADDGGTPPPPPPSNPPYTARAVLFGSDTTMNLRLDPNKTVVSITSYNADNAGDLSASLFSNLTPSKAAGGLYTLDVAPIAGGGKQYDYMTITYTDGTQQIIQVVVTDGQSWDSATENADNPPAASGITNEWHTQSDAATQGTDGGRFTNASSADEMWLAGIATDKASGDNIINTADGTDTIHVDNTIAAIYGNNTVTSSDSSTLNVHDGILARSGANTLTSGQVNIDIASDDAKAIIEAQGGSNVITGANGIALELDQGAANKSYMGLEATSGGSNTLTTKNSGADIELSVTSGAGGAAGLVAAGPWNSADPASNMPAPQNTLNSAGDVNLNISGAKGEHVGLKVSDGGINSVNAQGDVNVTVEGSVTGSSIYGALAQASDKSIKGVETFYSAGQNLVTAEGKIIFNSISGSGTISSAHGLYAGNDSSAGGATPVKFAALNDLAAQEVDINVMGVSAFGMVANSTGGAAPNDPHGNIISAGKVDIDVSSLNDSFGRAIGMKATGGGSNIINGTDVSVTVGGGSENYAMHAGRGYDNDISQNIIQAFQDDAAMSVTISANGNVSNNFAMYAEANGLNLIEGSQAGDLIQINGDIGAKDGGQNIIDTGSGDNTVVIDGAIRSADALIIKGGDGLDTLVLKAADGQDFMDKYESWLTAAADPINGLIDDIEVIQIDSSAFDGSADVSVFLENAFAGSSVDIIVSLDSGDNSWSASVGDVVHYIGGLGEDSLDLGALGDAHLSDLVGSYSGFEHLELSGGQTLTIDSLLDGLDIDTGLSGTISGAPAGLELTGSNILRVTGDEGADSVSVDPGTWGSSVGTVSYDGTDYTVYQHIDSISNESQYLLIQAGLLS